MRVVITRPAAEAARWSREFERRGHAPVALPLIEIGAAPSQDAVRAAWEQLPQCAAAMFVSANAVHGFLQARTGPWPATCRAWAPGPGTAGALRDAGVPAGSVDAPAAEAEQFDSEALWALVGEQVAAGWRVLLVQGADARGQAAGRSWLAERLAERGAAVQAVAAYRRQPAAWSAAQRQQAVAAAADGSVWLFSSSEAVRHLRDLLPGTGWGQARAIATHERIAQAARDAGFGVVWPSRPSVDAVCAALESIR